MPKKPYSRKSKFPLEKRKQIAQESLGEPDSIIAARYGIRKKTLANWRMRFQLKKSKGAAQRNAVLARKKNRAEKEGAKRRARTKTAQSNGHAAPSNGAPTIESALFELRQAQHANRRAIESLEAVQQAYLRVFGGG